MVHASGACQWRWSSDLVRGARRLVHRLGPSVRRWSKPVGTRLAQPEITDQHGLDHARVPVLWPSALVHGLVQAGVLGPELGPPRWSRVAVFGPRGWSRRLAKMWRRRSTASWSMTSCVWSGTRRAWTTPSPGPKGTRASRWIALSGSRLVSPQVQSACRPASSIGIAASPPSEWSGRSSVGRGVTTFATPTLINVSVPDRRCCPGLGCDGQGVMTAGTWRRRRAVPSAHPHWVGYRAIR